MAVGLGAAIALGTAQQSAGTDPAFRGAGSAERTALQGDALAVKGQAETGAAPSPLEQFKQFIASPPIIQNLVFAQKVPMGGGMRPLDGSFAFSTSWEYFQAKWQTNGFLFRRIASPSEATNFSVAGQLVSWSGHRHALVEPTRFLTTWDDRDPALAGVKLGPLYTYHFFLDPLRVVLNLGIMYAEIGAVHWKGNRFRTECDVDQDHLVITGEVLPATEGPPQAMKVCYRFPRQTNDYIVRYGYGTPPTVPPIVLTNFWLPNHRGGGSDEVELNQWRSLEIQTSDGPLPLEAFAVEPFAQQHPWHAMIYTNGGLYERSTNGTLELRAMLKARNPPVGLPPSRTKLAVFYAGWGILNLAIFALVLRAKERQQTNLTTNETNL